MKKMSVPLPTPDEQSLKLPQRRVAQLVTVCFLAAYVVSPLVATAMWAFDVSGGPSPQVIIGFGICVVVLPALGILGVIWASWSGIKGWIAPPITIAFLILSIVMTTILIPMTTVMSIGSRFRPWAEAQAKRAATDTAAFVKAEKATHYDALRQHFQTSRTVTDAKDGFLRLADDNVIQVIDYGCDQKCNERFRSWCAQNLVGRQVRIVLPDRATFNDNYIPGLQRGFPGSRPRDPKTGTSYGTVPGVILLDDEIFNLRFSRYPETSEKWFRDQLANNM